MIASLILILGLCFVIFLALGFLLKNASLIIVSVILGIILGASAWGGIEYKSGSFTKLNEDNRSVTTTHQTTAIRPAYSTGLSISSFIISVGLIIKIITGDD